MYALRIVLFMIGYELDLVLQHQRLAGVELYSFDVEAVGCTDPYGVWFQPVDLDSLLLQVTAAV